MTAPHSPGHPDTTRRIDLNLVQVAAAALAAVTAAVLGSTLGAAGTLIGAASASVITTIGTAVYRASLERSTQRVRTLALRTRLSPTAQEGLGTSHSPAAQAPPADEQLTGSADYAQRRFSRFATLRWGAMIVGALGGFVLAMGVITGFEAASGETLGGNGAGTTLGQVVDAPPDSQRPVVPPVRSSSAPTSVAPTETSVPSSSATSTSSPDASSVAQSPTPTSDTPAPSEVRPTPSLVPSRIPGVAN